MKHYKNLFINQLNTKDVDHFTTDTGLFLRRKTNEVFRKLCNIFTNAAIIREDIPDYASDEEYYKNLKSDRIPLSHYPLSTKKMPTILLSSDILSWIKRKAIFS